MAIQKVSSGNQVRLLLVDDEKSFVDVLALRLSKRGFHVVSAHNGKEAFHQIEMDDGIDVIILDLAMPGGDGIETLQQSKKYRPLIEVIMLTGHATIDSAVEAMKSGAFDYIVKPLDLDELVSKVKGAYDRKKQREADCLEARMKPYITEKEREALIFKILNS
jgi:DNA-binding NtrC family response regulator